jgi:Domain of unknown function (DUF5615)
MLRLLADENVPAPSITALRAAGHDVVSVAEVAAGSPDDAVLALAIADGRLIVTLDRDFGELLFRRGAGAGVSGVIYFRDAPGPIHVAAVLGQLSRLPALPLVGLFTVVTGSAIRQRALPSR